MDFEILVVGGGHAGVEAALAAARMGAATGCVVLDPAAMGRMSCNPAIGGLAKGQLVREIDALGGEMGLCTDAAGIQFRILNTSKGAAVRSPRAQCDRAAYNRYMARVCAGQAGLTLVQGEAVHLLAATIGGAREVLGVVLADGRELRAAAVVLTTGTFLGGKLFAGSWEEPGGRLGEAGATALSQALLGLGLRLGRHKTGTPPRLVRSSIDFAGLEEQPGDLQPQPFSFRSGGLTGSQMVCHLTHTNPAAHRIIAEHADQSPMYQGRIVGAGPRYCPSVEDKVMRFPDQQRHQVFLEPEGRDCDEVYPAGISTSLPIPVQERFLRCMQGLEDVQIARPGYAVEYDHLCTEQIRADLSVVGVKGLYSAGQINGTSGYEEAAAQGLMAGINAVQASRGLPPVILDRASSYIGVMIDDLCRVNPREPYRMFTSRAEFRLLLRADNADRRLSPLGHELGLLDAEQAARVAARQQAVERCLALLARRHRSDGKSLQAWLRRPEVSLGQLIAEEPELAALELPADLWVTVEAEVKYEGFIARQQREVERVRAMNDHRIPEDFDFAGVPGFSAEARELLLQRRPLTVGEALRIPGVRPVDINLLLTLLRRPLSRRAGPR